MDKQTTITFTPEADIQPTLEAWTKAEGFKLKSEDGGRRVFQKGSGLMVAPMFLEVEGGSAGESTTLTACIRVGTFTRAFSLFMLPPQMGVQSGGFKGVAPRKIARKAINKLLVQLGQPEIA